VSVSGTTPAAAPRERSVLLALLALVRWPNALIASGGVVLGAWWVQPGFPWTRELGLGILATWCVTAAVNALNDAADVEIDRVAHPDRPIPRGDLSRSTVLRAGVGAWLLGFAVAQAMPTVPAMIVDAALLVAIGYAFSLNARLVLGNLVVAIVASLPFLLGGALVGDAGDALPLFVVAVPLHFAREVMKDVADAPGDRAHRDTIPLRWGARAARGIALVSVAAYTALASVLFVAAGLRLLALLPSALVAAWAVVKAPARAPTLLKLAMLLAMAALPFLR
jgi:geranylgeranylglycerol-phosphate geranylgeranyltransferase